MKKMKFQEGEGFNLDDLKKSLQMGFVPDDKFKIYVNGELIKPKYTENSTNFKVDETGKHMGKVPGEIYYTSRTIDHAVLHAYVN